jgi:serine-type D-Ala-D-Ala carboxypeptidase/endopeptidase (penicillin-binding protein 4)
MRQLIFKICFISLLSFQAQTETKINTTIQKSLEQPLFKGASLSCQFYNVKTNKIVGSYQPNLLLAPASVTKIITTAAALLHLGVNYKYETTFHYTGIIASNVLNGDLIVNGSGDPTSYSEYFANDMKQQLFVELNKKILALGISKINGDIIINATCFDEQFANSKWPYEDIGNYYGAGASGISYGDNKYEIILKKENDSLVIVDKQLSGLDLKINANIKSKGSSDDAYVYSMPLNTNSINIYGSIPSSKTSYSIFAAHPNPPLYFGNQLKKYLKENGVDIKGIAKTEKSNVGSTQLIYKHLSPPLSEIIFQTNQESDNHYAECLMKTLGQKLFGNGTTENGIKAIKTIFKTYNLDISAIEMYDGCGLSPFNAISAETLNAILKLIYNKNTIKEIYFNSLPLSGKQGSLKSFGKGTSLENNMRAKTGYIEKVRAYSGVFKNKNGDDILFSIMINKYLSSPSEARKLLEKICLEVYNL